MTTNLLNPACDPCYDCEAPCFCLDIPLTVTFSGATGCLSIMNATFALTSSPTLKCGFDYYLDNRPAPADPCSSPDACYLNPLYSSWLWWLSTVSVGVRYNTTNALCTAYITTYWVPYSKFGYGQCYVRGSEIIEEVVFRRDGCTSGALSIISSRHEDPNIGTLPTACTIGF